MTMSLIAPYQHQHGHLIVPFFDKKKLKQQLLFQQPTTQPQQQKTGRNNAWLLQSRFAAIQQHTL
jgi:hypothetical protein